MCPREHEEDSARWSTLKRLCDSVGESRASSELGCFGSHCRRVGKLGVGLETIVATSLSLSSGDFEHEGHRRLEEEHQGVFLG